MYMDIACFHLLCVSEDVSYYEIRLNTAAAHWDDGGTVGTDNDGDTWPRAQ